MEKFSRSKSSRESVVQQPASMNGLRSYSTSAYNPPQNVDYNNKCNFKEVKIKRGNSSKIWGIHTDPELQRRKRVAGYKAYAMEGKMRGSVKKSFRWIKDACNQFVHGVW